MDKFFYHAIIFLVGVHDRSKGRYPSNDLDQNMPHFQKIRETLASARFADNSPIGQRNMGFAGCKGRVLRTQASSI